MASSFIAPAASFLINAITGQGVKRAAKWQEDGFYSITFIEYVHLGKTLLDYTNLFPPNDCKKNKRQYTITLKKNVAKENGGLEFRLKK